MLDDSNDFDSVFKVLVILNSAFLKFSSLELFVSEIIVLLCDVELSNGSSIGVSDYKLDILI